MHPYLMLVAHTTTVCRWSEPSIKRLHQEINKSDGASCAHLLPNAGHWLHVDNPEGLLKLIIPELCSIP